MSGQYVAYSFYRVDPAWRRLPIDERAAGKDACAEVVEDWAGRMDALRAYSVAGVRPDCDFFLWKITERYEDLGELGAALNGTPLAAWLETPYSYLATTKASEYTSARKARKIVPKESPYLVVYPFVKVRPWYALSDEDRRRAMDEHIRIGRDEFPTIHNHTTYSFGIDDQEFMTAFECDEPADFMHLMLRLRDSEASRYTERDTSSGSTFRSARRWPRWTGPRLGSGVWRRPSVREVVLGRLGCLPDRLSAADSGAGGVSGLGQEPFLGLARVLAAELLAQVGLILGFPTDPAYPAPESHAEILVPVGTLGPPDAPHRIAGQDQDDDEGERVEPDRPPSGPEVGGEVNEDQQGAAVENAVRALRPGLDLVPHPVAPEHVENDRDREEEDDLQDQ